MPASVEQGDFSSVATESYPWPNESTTAKGSSIMMSPVAFGDFDNNTFEDAAFLSVSPDQKQVLLRVVRSGSFTEQFNLMYIPSRPDAFTTMIFEDIDMNSGYKELIYLNGSRTHLVGLDLSGTPGRLRFNLPLIEPISYSSRSEFRVIRMGQNRGLEIGNNILIYGPNQAPTITSGSTPIHGGWGLWSGWHVFNNGTTCSKRCGNGMAIRNRACNQPTPRNGGSNCLLESASTACSQSNPGMAQGLCTATTLDDFVGAVHSRACWMRACEESECTSNETFINGDCRSNGSDDSGGGSRPGDGGGGIIGGGDGGGGNPGGGGGNPGGGNPGGGGGVPGVITPSDCTTSEVYDVGLSRCFTAYPADDIFLTYFERVYLPEGESENIEHTYRLSLNHGAAIGQAPRTTAAEYCRFLGHFDVVSFDIGSYVAQGGKDQNAYVLCNQATNGKFQSCQLKGGQNDWVRFTYSGITYQVGQQVQYLKSVICRKSQ